ncbi:hypothetical protein [Alcaligenes faecalis]|uniref:hypothetical protein n=1 Tax=Alcaligenes faecalis TaxID=511 RepID=UPI0034D5AC16
MESLSDYEQSLVKENRLLLDQLQLVQEELGRLHDSPHSIGGGKTQTVVHVAPVDTRFVKVEAERLRLECLLGVQTRLHELKTQYALSGQLGEILIEGVRSTGALLTVPGRLRQVWRQNRRTQPPAMLGGKSFDKVIQAYQQGGDQQLESLLSQAAVSRSIQASAWTAVARTYQTSDPELVATLARRAFDLEPRGFRQKWLAFRLHEAGDSLEAEALLTLLPDDVSFTDSESRQRDRLLKQAKEFRVDQVRMQHQVASRNEAVQRQWDELAQERNALLGQVRQLQGQQQFAQQEQRDRQALLKQVEDLALALEQESALTLQTQQQAVGLQAELKQLNQTLVEKEAQAGQWFEQCVTVQGGLAEMVQQCEQLKLELQNSQDEKEAVLTQLQQLQEEQQALLLQAQTLTVSHDEQALRAAQYLEQVSSLQSQLNQLAQSREEYAVLAAQRQGELLQQAKEQLGLEKSKAALENRQRELEQLLAAQTARETDLLERLHTQVQSLATREAVLPGLFEDLFKKQADDLVRVRRHLETAVKSNSANAVRQLQSFVGMQEYFATGVLPAFNSEAHSWPVSADFALCVMRQLVLQPYDLVIEFGSGMSTVIVAKTLALMAERHEAQQTRFVSFEHLDAYYQQTHAYLQQAGLANAVQLTLAPLAEWHAPDDQVYPYYSCQSTLAKLAKQKPGSRNRILVIVDGPPASTGPQARYPAGPLLVEHFPDACIDFLMDDYIREDEKQVLQRWLAEINVLGRVGTLTEYKLEKDACLLTVQSKDSK